MKKTSQNPTAQIFTSTVALMNGFAPLRQTNVAIILNNGVIWVKSWQASKSHDTHYWMLNILSAVNYNSTEADLVIRQVQQHVTMQTKTRAWRNKIIWIFCREMVI